MDMKKILQTDLPLKYLAHSEGVNKPLIIFLHGYGSNEGDLFSLRQELMPDYTYVSVRAPLTLYEGSYQWFSLQLPTGGLLQIEKELMNSEKILEEFISACAQKYQTTKDKIILVGFSQGAIMCYQMALKNPELVRGIACLSGMILPTQQITPGMDLKNLAIFIGHGTNDQRVPYFAGEVAYEALLKTSVRPTWRSYQGLGHSINEHEIKDINEWIQQTLTTPR